MSSILGMAKQLEQAPDLITQIQHWLNMIHLACGMPTPEQPAMQLHQATNTDTREPTRGRTQLEAGYR